jgi:hypothetical protein
MPFDNLTSDEEMGTLVRKSFYNHFSSKNFKDIELSTVDRALESIQRRQAGTWREVPPEALGKYLHADFVIYGKVKDYQKLFFGIYSQITLTVEVEMVESRSGKGVWWKTETKRSHEGGIPLEVWSLMSVDIQIASFLEKSRAVASVEECKRIGFEPKVELVQVADHTWYRVVLGPYRDVPAAERDKKLIAERTKFQPIFVHHIPGNQEASPR